MFFELVKVLGNHPLNYNVAVGMPQHSMHRESGSNQFVSRNVATLPHLLHGGGGIQESTVMIEGLAANFGFQPLGGWNQGARCRSRVLLT